MGRLPNHHLLTPPPQLCVSIQPLMCKNPHKYHVYGNYITMATVKVSQVFLKQQIAKTHLEKPEICFLLGIANIMGGNKHRVCFAMQRPKSGTRAPAPAPWDRGRTWESEV